MLDAKYVMLHKDIAYSRHLLWKITGYLLKRKLYSIACDLSKIQVSSAHVYFGLTSIRVNVLTCLLLPVTNIVVMQQVMCHCCAWSLFPVWQVIGIVGGMFWGLLGSGVSILRPCTINSSRKRTCMHSTDSDADISTVVIYSHSFLYSWNLLQYKHVMPHNARWYTIINEHGH